MIQKLTQCLIILAGVLWLNIAAANDRPNIVLIMADDLGKECFADYGGLDYQTPNIESLGRSGLRFRFAFSQPVCTPSRVQIMTGRYNHRNYEGFGYLNPKEITFANLLKDSGYRTCIAGKWQLSGNAETIRNFGFDRHCVWNMISYLPQDANGIKDLPQDHRRRYSDPVLYRDGKFIRPGDQAYGPDICTDFLIEFINDCKKSESPFLAYYPMILTHDPFVPTPKSSGQPLSEPPRKKNFQDMVAYADHLVGRLVEALEKNGQRENTLIIFTGDNGTHTSISSRTKLGQYKGGKSLPNDRGTHVPLYISWPAKIQPGTSDALVDFSDILPTLISAAKTDLPSDRAIDGKSMMPVLLGQASSHRSHVFFSYWKRGRNKEQTSVWVRDHSHLLYQDGRFLELPDDALSPIEVKTPNAQQQEVRQKLEQALQNHLK